MAKINMPDWGDEEETATYPQTIDEADYYKSGSNPNNFYSWLDIFETPLSNPASKLVFEGDFNIPKNALEGIKNPNEADDWFDFAFRIPSSVFDKMDKSLWGEELHNQLTEEQKNMLYDGYRTAIGTTGAIFLDLDSIADGISLMGNLDDGLTIMKLGTVAPILNKADDIDQFIDTMKQYNISPNSTMGQNLIKMFDEGKEIKISDSLGDAIQEGQKALITKGQGDAVRLPGKAGEVQKAGEVKVGEGVDWIKSKLYDNDLSKELRQVNSKVNLDVPDEAKLAFDNSRRRTNRVVELFQDQYKTFSDDLTDIAKKTEFNKNELLELHEINKPISEFKGKKVPDGLKDELNRAFKPLEDIEKKLDTSPNIKYSADNPKLFDSKMNYVPRQTTQEAKEAMRQANPDWYRKFYGSSKDSDLFNSHLQDRVFKNNYRYEIDELANKGKLGVVANNNGGISEVGNYDELAKKYPEKANRNMVVNLTGGEKVDFYKPYSEDAMQNYFENMGATIGKEETFQDVLSVGSATGDIKPLSDSKAVEEGYVRLTENDVGNLAPMFEDVQVRKSLADEITKANEFTGQTELEYTSNIVGNLMNNFKRQAIGLNPEYQFKNPGSNLMRSFSDPTRSTGKWAESQVEGYLKTLADSPVGKKLNLNNTLKLDNLIELPTGESKSVNNLFDEFLEQGNLASGFRGNVIDKDNVQTYQDIINEFMSKLNAGTGTREATWSALMDTTSKTIEDATKPGIWAREHLAENPNRFGDYLASRKEGYLPNAATDRQFTNLIDYGDFGKGSKTLNTYVPFYRYQLGSKSVMIPRMIQNPGKFKYPAKFQNMIEASGEYSEDEKRKMMEENPPPDYMNMPVWAGVDEEGRVQYADYDNLLGGNLDYVVKPTIDILTKDNYGGGDFAEDIISAGIQSANPFLSTGYAITTGKDTLGRDIPAYDTIFGDRPYPGKVASAVKNLNPAFNFFQPLTNDKTSAGEKINEIINPLTPRTSYSYNEDIEEKMNTVDTIDDLIYDIQNFREQDTGKTESFMDLIENLRKDVFDSEDTVFEEEKNKINMPDW